MKIVLLALLLAVAKAKEFNVTSEGSVCLLLSLDGNITLSGTTGKNTTATKTLEFNEAEVLSNSSCTMIRLNLSYSVEVWFEFDNGSSHDDWKVTPKSSFIPFTVFGEKFNLSDPLIYTSEALGMFSRNESFQCLSSDEHDFKGDHPLPEYNFTVVAHTHNLTIQSLNGSHFVPPGNYCKGDINTTTSTVAPTTTTTTPPTTTTPKTTYSQNFSCHHDNITRFLLLGTFSLTISYNQSWGQEKTVTIDVPTVKTDYNKTCENGTEEMLSFGFFKDWSIKFIFKSDKPHLLSAPSKYHISNISVVYVYDEHFPNASSTPVPPAEFTGNHYLEASTDGYYSCKAKTSLKVGKEVTLITKDFQYRAFNEKGDIKFDGNNVTECSEDEETSSVVPIAVGAALAGLVVIVLIAYLIGRRRSRKSGYESV